MFFFSPKNKKLLLIFKEGVLLYLFIIEIIVDKKAQPTLLPFQVKVFLTGFLILLCFCWLAELLWSNIFKNKSFKIVLYSRSTSLLNIRE